MAHTEERTIKAGTKILVGRPANPLPKEFVQSVAQLVARFPTILEAHLPMMHFVDSGQEPAQVLVLVFASGSDVQGTLREIYLGLQGIVPDQKFLDVIPMFRGHDFVNLVRNANCMIHTTGKKPWWQFW